MSRLHRIAAEILIHRIAAEILIHRIAAEILIHRYPVDAANNQVWNSRTSSLRAGYAPVVSEDMKKYIVVIYSLLCVVSVSASNTAYRCSFGTGAWEPSDWQIVKSPRWSYVGSWNQHGDHISNKVPGDASEQDMLGKRAGETYTSMLLKQKFSDDVKISSTLSFDHRMAPLLVITSAYGKDAAGIPEHRDHFEVVLYDQGLNVWHHFYENGKPYWKKAAFLEGEFKPKQRYTLTVTIKFTTKGPVMTVSCDGKTFGYLDNTLPEKFYVGLTGCEGINRFYDFCVVPLNL